MKLTKFSITNYRSITTAHQINISDLTVLVGKNNEGKSNILKALNLAMTTLENNANVRKKRALRPPTFRRRYEDHFFWERDFPIEFQSRQQGPGTRSNFRLEFELNDEEVTDFRKLVGSKINNTLPISVKFGKDNVEKITVEKKGRGKKTLSENSEKISKFIIDRINFNYIPAVRTDQEALSIIREMVSDELRVLEKDEEYIKALETITNLQMPVLDIIASKIQEPLREFLPDIKSVKLNISRDRRLSALRGDVDMIIDDGFPTGIEYKGDGVKSLITLALLKNRDSISTQSIIAIEEPESHLHPEAIHQLREIIFELSRSNQVLVSTHNPLFVDRNEVPSNIIINDRKAIAAKNIQEIRNILGVQASDNLISAKYVLLVEGKTDLRSLKAILPTLSQPIKNALRNHSLVIEEIGGAGNLGYRLASTVNSLCTPHVLLDNDESGTQALHQAKRANRLSEKDYTLTNCIGMPKSEFEDTIDQNIYLGAAKDKFGVDLTIVQGNTKAKWSDRVKSSFLCHGKEWNAQIETDVKVLVTECIEKQPRKALHQSKRHSIDALVNSLESLIKPRKPQ